MNRFSDKTLSKVSEGEMNGPIIHIQFGIHNLIFSILFKDFSWKLEYRYKLQKETEEPSWAKLESA